ncbi:MAG: hypothetical protein H6560_00435 [Lewinellaceae bacterium]|nr:hypothetical protein [Lewinellaceae bacterium]
MRKVLKWAGIILGVLVAVVIAAGVILNEPLPEGETGPDADRVARAMLETINKEAWDSTRYVRWDFPGGHQYIWDKFRRIVQVEWGDKKVLLHTPTQSGRAWEEGVEQQETAAENLRKEAWGFFCNDSFWLNAPAKVFDPGTTRSLVDLGNGHKGLLVRYSSGGVTPGDAYLWSFDKQGLPASWKMWVSIIPVGGLKASWEGWTRLETGARLSTRHKVGFLSFGLSNVKGGSTLQSVGLNEDPFQLLEN